MVVSMGVYPAKAANDGGHDISCGDHRYFIETSWFGADVRIININDNAATDSSILPIKCRRPDGGQTFSQWR